MSEPNTTKGLKLLDDALFDPETQEDAFGHTTYANLLTRIFDPSSGNRPGLSVALFGRWGQGKSSVVRMLQNNFAKQTSAPEGTSLKVNIIWFNAWKSRGDHIRRQLLLSIIKGIDSPNYDSISKFTRPGIPLELRSFEEQKEVDEKASLLALVTKQHLGPVEACAALTGGLSLLAWIASQCISSFPAKFSTIPLFSFFSSCIVYIWRFLGTRKEKILTSVEPVSDSQRLKYPDQFQKVFEQELADYKIRDARPLIVVVDDLDRCECGTVVEALACIRQLGGKPLFEKEIADCRFLVPCDEEQVISALTADGHHTGYEEDELLRKFFDVIIRMDVFVPEDMVSYALKALPQDIAMTPDDLASIRELIGAVAPRNPREVKKLINAYLISRAKLEEAREGQTFREEQELPHLIKTQLLVIALRETVPNIYSRTVDNPYFLNTLINTDAPEESSAAKKAEQIYRALQPVSMRTFRLLVRKGLPETLRAAEKGPIIYDSVTTGDVKAFSQAISETGNLSHVIAWLKEYRATLNSTAQLRHVLACFGKTNNLTPKLLNSVEDYLTHPRLADALNGFDGLVEISKLSIKLRKNKRQLHNAILSNFRKLGDDHVLLSNELTALLLCATDLTEEAKSLCASKIAPLFNTAEVQAAKERLEALNQQLDRIDITRYMGIMPKLALSIAKQCSWELYSTRKPEKNMGLHSRPIAALIGTDASNLKELVQTLFSKQGPLTTPLDLQQDSNKGEHEALRTLQNVASRLPDEIAQEVYSKLKAWMDAQPQNTHDHSHFRLSCEAIQKSLFSLTDKQLKQFADLLADRSISASDPEWLCEYIEVIPKTTKDHEQKYITFCKDIFNRIATNQLSGNTVPNRLTKLLTAMKEKAWDISVEADTVLAEAVKNIHDGVTWEIWKSCIWPLCRAKCPKTTQAVLEQIKADTISSVFIDFAVRDICNNHLTHALQTTLKDYFKYPSSLSNEAFIRLFEDDNVEGTTKILEFIIEDLESGISSLNSAQIQFLATHCPHSSRNILFKYLRIHYLQNSDSGAFSTGLRYVNIMNNPPKDVLQEIRKHSTEQVETLPDEDKEIIKQLLGNDIFAATETTEADSHVDA